MYYFLLLLFICPIKRKPSAVEICCVAQDPWGTLKTNRQTCP